MELKYKENLSEFVTDEQIAERNRIMQKISENRKPTKKEADFLMNFEKKTRICCTCGKSVSEAGLWNRANMIDYPEVYIGYHFQCFSCELQSIVLEGRANNW